MIDIVTPTPPLIIGDSHAGFLAKAFGEYAGGFDDINLGQAIPIVCDGETVAECIIINPYKTAFFTERFENEGCNLVISVDSLFYPILQMRSGRCQRVLLSLMGNSHNAQFMMQAGVPFDFHDPRWPGLYQSDHQVMPREVLLQHFDVSARLLSVKLNLLRQYLGDVPMYWFAPPPPIPSHEHIAAFPEGFRMAENGITHPWVRLKIYHSYVDILAAVAEEQGVFVLRAPEACIDENGFLLPLYWNHCTHATPEYYAAICAIHFPGEANECAAHGTEPTL